MRKLKPDLSDSLIVDIEPGRLHEGGDLPPQPLGRKRDHSRDAHILKAAADVLSEVGYEGMTMDIVAARAKAGKATVYRRWSSKSDLVLDAIAHMKQTQFDLDRLPDTGALRGDLLALFRPQAIMDREYKLKVMAGLASMLKQHPRLAEAGNAALIEPWVAVYRTLIGRAIDRGEISTSVDIETASHIVPSMAAYRTLIQHKPFDLEFLLSLIDGVLLPALRSGTVEGDIARVPAAVKGRAATRPRRSAQPTISA